MIIDCHTHLSRFGHQGMSFDQIRNHLLADMNEYEVDCSFVLPDSEPGAEVADLNTAGCLTRGHAQLLLLGTACISTLRQSVIESLDVLAAAGEIIGIKLYPGFELFYPDEGCCHGIYELCTRYDMPVVFHSGETMAEPWREEYNHPREIARVAERFPALKIVVAHFSQPHLGACRDLLLRFSNVCADISGLAHPDVIRTCGQNAIMRSLEAVAGLCPEKVLFGTDWPLCDVGEHLRLVDSLCIPQRSKRLILGQNAAHLFGLG
jgi:predicted TIM-barrel fold metal-dependent hydrolase